MNTGTGQDSGQIDWPGRYSVAQPWPAGAQGQESDAQDGDKHGRRPPGKGNYTFFSHRQIGITAGFAGSNHLLEQGPLEVWQLREGEKHQRVKTTSYTLGAVLWATGARIFQDQMEKSKQWYSSCLRCVENIRPAGKLSTLSGSESCHVQCLRVHPPVSPWAPGCPVPGQEKGHRHPRVSNCILLSCQGDPLVERI